MTKGREAIEEWFASRGWSPFEFQRRAWDAYEFGENGLIEEANCIIPTGQNLGNVDRDMRALVPTLLTEPEDSIRLKMEMLVRAYDPCISCSTHFLNVEFVGK